MLKCFSCLFDVSLLYSNVAFYIKDNKYHIPARCVYFIATHGALFELALLGRGVDQCHKSSYLVGRLA